MQISQIFINNHHWINERLELDGDYFEKLSRGQSPELLYIGCSDSRVTAEDLMGASPGEIFIHRNIANLVPNNDLSAASVINYAVCHLGVKHIVICGHYYCGGVMAAMKVSDMGVLNPWLRNIQDVYRLHVDELNAINDDEIRYKRLVELNVQEQCTNLLKMIEVQLALTEGKIQIHGWVFDIKTGKLIDLRIDFASIATNLTNIYRYR